MNHAPTLPCCTDFSDALSQAGERGLAIVVVRLGLEHRFVIVSRGLAFRDVEANAAWHQQNGGPDTMLNIADQRFITYCPWCGAALEPIIRNNIERVHDLCNEHRAVHELRHEL